MRNKNYYYQKGITLVALVVTIVILLILAGVSINMVLGNDGIITKAKEAKEKLGDSEVLEKVELAVMASYISEGETINLDTLNTELEKIDGLGKLPIDANIGLPYIVTYNDKGILISNTGNAKFVSSTGKNLFNVDDSSFGFIRWDDGIIAYNPSWKFSNAYIKCKANTQYVFSYESNDYFQAALFFYDENKNYISGYSKEGMGISQVSETAPSNAKYLRVSYSVKVHDIDVTRSNIQLEEGSTRTSYEPYFNLLEN